jgi:hypothetical protein
MGGGERTSAAGAVKFNPFVVFGVFLDLCCIIAQLCPENRRPCPFTYKLPIPRKFSAVPAIAIAAAA